MGTSGYLFHDTGNSKPDNQTTTTPSRNGDFIYMTASEEQQFLNDLEKTLWNAADKLRSSLDAAQYKHAVLGLVFLK